MSKQLITVQDGNGMPLGSLFVQPEPGIDNPENWLKGELRFVVAGATVELNVDLIAVKQENGNAVPRDPMFKEEIMAAYDLVGGQPPSLLRIGDIDYVVLIYPRAD